MLAHLQPAASKTQKSRRNPLVATKAQSEIGEARSPENQNNRPWVQIKIGLITSVVKMNLSTWACKCPEIQAGIAANQILKQLSNVRLFDGRLNS